MVECIHKMILGVGYKINYFCLLIFSFFFRLLKILLAILNDVSGDQNLIRNHGNLQNLEENISNFVIATTAAGDLRTSGYLRTSDDLRTSAGIVMTRYIRTVHNHQNFVFLLDVTGLTFVKFACRVDSRLKPSQWEMSLQSNAVYHWLGRFWVCAQPMRNVVTM